MPHGPFGGARPAAPCGGRVAGSDAAAALVTHVCVSGHVRADGACEAPRSPGNVSGVPGGGGAARPGAWAPRTDRRFSLAARGPAHDLPAGPADRVRDAPGAFLHGGFAAAPRCEQGVLLNKIKGLCKADVVYGGT